MFKLKTRAPIALFAAAAMLATPANAAAITYLECTMTIGGGKDTVWKIALDETARTVSFEHIGGSWTERGIFTADKVSWNDGSMVISRVDLTFNRTSVLGDNYVGKCKVVNPPKRAF